MDKIASLHFDYNMSSRHAKALLTSCGQGVSTSAPTPGHYSRMLWFRLEVNARHGAAVKKELTA